MSDAKIVARGVQMDFQVRDELGQKKTISALKNFDLDVRPGEFFTILGPSGCGKSTFLSMLAGL